MYSWWWTPNNNWPWARKTHANIIINLFIIKLRAFATFPLSSTQIAKLRTAFACHMIASLVFFNPKFAAIALSKFLAFNEIKSFLIQKLCSIWANQLLIIFACSSFMFRIVFNFAFQAIVLMAFRTSKFIISLLVFKDVIAAWCHAV